MHPLVEFMRYDDEQDPKKPHSVSFRRKGDNPSEAQENQPYEVAPDGERGGERDRYLPIRVPPAVPVVPQSTAP